MLRVVTLSPLKQARDMPLRGQQEGCVAFGSAMQLCEPEPWFCTPCVWRQKLAGLWYPLETTKEQT